MTETLLTPKHANMRGYYAGFVTRAIALSIDLIIIFVASFLFSLILRLFLNFFGFTDLASAVYDRTAVSETSSGSILVTIMRWFTAFLTSASFLFLYLIFFWTVIGKTPGKAIMGLRVIQDDEPTVKLKASIVRAIGYYVSLIPLGLGFFWVLGDDERRGWHDRMAHTHVLYDWDARLGRRLLDRLRRLRAGQLASSVADMVTDTDDTSK